MRQFYQIKYNFATTLFCFLSPNAFYRFLVLQYPPGTTRIIRRAYLNSLTMPSSLNSFSVKKSIMLFIISGLMSFPLCLGTVVFLPLSQRMSCARLINKEPQFSKGSYHFFIFTRKKSTHFYFKRFER